MVIWSGVVCSFRVSILYVGSRRVGAEVLWRGGAVELLSYIWYSTVREGHWQMDRWMAGTNIG
jgi:hypothetical protein